MGRAGLWDWPGQVGVQTGDAPPRLCPAGPFLTVNLYKTEGKSLALSENGESQAGQSHYCLALQSHPGPEEQVKQRPPRLMGKQR